MRLASSLVFLAFVSMAHAQPTPEPKDGKVIIPLTLSPTALPKPLSRFYLTPQYKELQPGNRIPSYMKAYMEQASFFSKDPAAEREKWNSMKLEDLPLEEMRSSNAANLDGLAYKNPDDTFMKTPSGPITFARSGRPLSDVDEGSRMLTSDWQMWFQIRRDGISTLIPEVQKMRELASVLNVRMRYEIATKDFDKAAYSARTFFGLVQAFETHPTLIAALVGLAIEAICLNRLEEMIQQPGCPNLYWSLTEIPVEVVNMRTAIQGEKLLCETLFGSLLNAKGEIPAAELERVIKQMDMVIYLAREGKKKLLDASIRYAELVKDEKKVAAGRAFLIETGIPPDIVKTFSALQVIATNDVRHYEVHLDELFKSYNLPHPDAEKLGDGIDAEWKKSPDASLSWTLIPAANNTRRTRIRVQQRVAYLRVIEAIRLHAFDNAGKLPASLKAIKTPLPLDPVTGEAFQYSLKDDIATLTGGNPNPGNANMNRVYEIRIRK